jgi:hypothetical protein
VQLGEELIKGVVVVQDPQQCSSPKNNIPKRSRVFFVDMQEPEMFSKYNREGNALSVW